MAAAAADLRPRRRRVAGAAAGAAVPAPAAPRRRRRRPRPSPFPTADERTAAPRADRERCAGSLRIAAVLAIVALGGWNLLLQDELGRRPGLRAERRRRPRRREPARRPDRDPAADGGTGRAGRRRCRRRRRHRDARPRADGGQQVYEAWVIGGDGVPVPLGGFTVGQQRDGVLHRHAGSRPRTGSSWR